MQQIYSLPFTIQRYNPHKTFIMRGKTIDELDEEGSVNMVPSMAVTVFAAVCLCTNAELFHPELKASEIQCTAFNECKNHGENLRPCSVHQQRDVKSSR